MVLILQFYANNTMNLDCVIYYCTFSKRSLSLSLYVPSGNRICGLWMELYKGMDSRRIKFVDGILSRYGLIVVYLNNFNKRK